MSMCNIYLMVVGGKEEEEATRSGKLVCELRVIEKLKMTTCGMLTSY